MLTIEACTLGKNLTTCDNKMELFNRYTSNRYPHRTQQRFYVNYKWLYIYALCCAEGIMVFVMRLGTRVAYYVL
ncbi:hypothetical protein S225a_20390 [Candidatus Brocadiaceae bacterium S225]|nr:hypothetical protein S225a_20390 [Candidatus Brocadiaceae bacterium S225]